MSYDSKNHEIMVHLRQKKIDYIQKELPLQAFDSGKRSGKLLILSWGSTYGTIREAMKVLLSEGHSVSHVHIEYLYPLARGLETILRNFEKVLIPELNNGQLIRLIRDLFLIDAISLPKIQGTPFTVSEIYKKSRELLV